MRVRRPVIEVAEGLLALEIGLVLVQARADQVVDCVIVEFKVRDRRAGSVAFLVTRGEITGSGDSCSTEVYYPPG